MNLTHLVAFLYILYINWNRNQESDCRDNINRSVILLYHD